MQSTDPKRTLRRAISVIAYWLGLAAIVTCMPTAAFASSNDLAAPSAASEIVVEPPYDYDSPSVLLVGDGRTISRSGDRGHQIEGRTSEPVQLQATRGAEGAFSRIVGFTERNLQKGFQKHGADFGLKGNWNPGRAGDFSRAVNQHINDPAVRAITGTYRGNPVTHFVNPGTGLNVISGPGGTM